MIEKVYEFKNSETKMIEKIVNDENAAINHMILTKDTGLPEHYSNSNVYMIIIRGTMSIKLDDQDTKEYMAGKILNIPYNTKMNVKNLHDDILEFFVVKAPSPKNYDKK
ncbi:cupin domain-containing protein [Thermohalobacter berrensis]|uniref:Cupin 2 conserved barrel domain-containing protein n=1 Tax=Thermohalobacter berrensis TaxID=99594 RepID=A0A419SUE9_9FIRM|nr:cupin domain-containing protein [Thermohalobacter berrensis]RKD28796.1 hypothetical protein BET03_07105 [Thermohalobacter berrensis]